MSSLPHTAGDTAAAALPYLTGLYGNRRASLLSMPNFQFAGAFPYECRHPDINLSNTYCIRTRHKIHWESPLFPVNPDVVPVGIVRCSFDPEREMTASVQPDGIPPPSNTVCCASYPNVGNQNGDINCDVDGLAKEGSSGAKADSVPAWREAWRKKKGRM
jgi:hypothetical protein